MKRLLLLLSFLVHTGVGASAPKESTKLIAGLFMRLHRPNVDFAVVESTRHETKIFTGNINLDDPCPSTYYVVRERLSGDASFYAGFQAEAHVQTITKRIKSGELVDQRLLREAFADFLKRHKTFGFEIDHKELSSYFESLKVDAEKPKAKL